MAAATTIGCAGKAGNQVRDDDRLTRFAVRTWCSTDCWPGGLAKTRSG